MLRHESKFSSDELDEVIKIYKGNCCRLLAKTMTTIENMLILELGIIEIIDPEGIAYPIHSSNIKQAVLQGALLLIKEGDPVKDFSRNWIVIWGCGLNRIFISKVKKYSRLSSVLEEAKEVVYVDKILLDAIEKMEYRISIIILHRRIIARIFQKDGNWYLRSLITLSTVLNSQFRGTTDRSLHSIQILPKFKLPFWNHLHKCYKLLISIKIYFLKNEK
ncbi:MAG: hypothetical protein IPG53_11960 [Ignavibacteriales bacterium]|nr:hypothetical protein [Ignavibacteriales bacterium]